MKSQKARESIKVWRIPDLKNLELHRGTTVFRDYPRHWHEEFHLCVIEGGGGTLYYRGSGHHTPAGSFFIVHPGELHSNRADKSGCSYRNLYIDIDSFQNILEEIAGERSIPFFREPVLFDAGIISLYLKLHRTLEVTASRLAKESLMLNLFGRLIGNYAADRPSFRPPGNERRAVKHVREYLIDNYAADVSLEELAQLVGISRFHLSRVFCSEVGLPPHAFQNRVRVLQAKSFLKQGWTISDVAQATGFADQSHLTRHFKRLVGVAPGEYRKAGKNLQSDIAP